MVRRRVWQLAPSWPGWLAYDPRVGEAGWRGAWRDDRRTVALLRTAPAGGRQVAGQVSECRRGGPHPTRVSSVLARGQKWFQSVGLHSAMYVLLIFYFQI
jgi:hypothetical protein